MTRRGWLSCIAAVPFSCLLPWRRRRVVAIDDMLQANSSRYGGVVSEWLSQGWRPLPKNATWIIDPNVEANLERLNATISGQSFTLPIDSIHVRFDKQALRYRFAYLSKGHWFCPSDA